MKSRVLLLIVFISISSLSCTSEKSEWQGTIQNVDEVTVVKNPVEPLNPNLEIVFEEDLTIGLEEGDEHYMFGGRIIFNTDVHGNFYVTDWGQKTIKKYDPSGKYLLSIGRSGQGPGEFQNISIARFDKENNLYVTDIVSRRISFFDNNGKFLNQLIIEKQLLVPLFINSNGHILSEHIVVEELPELIKSYSIIGLFDTDLNMLAEIRSGSDEIKPQPKRDAESTAKRHARLISQDAFKPQLTYLLSDTDHIYYGLPKHYEIKVYNTEGELERIIERDYEPLEVTKKETEDYLAELEEEVYKYVPLPEKVKKRAFELAEFPEYKPAYQKFTLMENGWLFVDAGQATNGLTLIDIFDQEGKYLAQFMTDLPTGKLFFKNGKAYALDTINDFHYVKRYSFSIMNN